MKNSLRSPPRDPLEAPALIGESVRPDPPAWTAEKGALSIDPDLRQLQLAWARGDLHWYRDELWMRRIRFFVALALLALALLLQPGPMKFGVGIASLIGFFLAARRPRATPKH